ncbi:hypothetical protein DFJ43DRAFT_991301, partial [Lentinula guzmanii]
QFRKTVCHVSTNGDTHFEDLSDVHEIEVSKGWTRFVKTGVPNGGYLSKGLYKYGILARFNGNQVALFTHKPAGSSNNLNSTALHDELDLLVQGDAFAKSFKNRALAANVKLPGDHFPKHACTPHLITVVDLKYNAEGAFVGTVTVPLPGSGLPIDDETIEQEAANRSLLFDTFLVVPLLQTKGLFSERKFSGNTDTGENSDYVGKVVDAFAHHVVEETNGHLMLADLQGVVGPDRSIILFDPQAHRQVVFFISSTHVADYMIALEAAQVNGTRGLKR